MRTQIAFRKSGETFHGHSVLIAVGVLESADPSVARYEDRFVNFRAIFDQTAGMLSSLQCLGNPHEITQGFGKEDDEHLLHMCDLENLQTTSLQRTVPDGMVNAELAVRATDMEPGKPGAIVYAFSGLVYVRPEQKADVTHLYQLEALQDAAVAPQFMSGIVGQTVRKEIGPINVEEDTRGDALSGFLRRPWWGFGDEPMSLPGTMRREVYRRLDRYAELFFKERSGDEAKEFEELQREMRFIGMNTLEKDATYARFVEKRREHGITLYRPQRLSTIQAEKSINRAIIRSLLDEAEPRGLGM